MRTYQYLAAITVFAVACGGTVDGNPEVQADDAELKASTLNNQRYAILEGKLPELGLAAANDFAKTIGAPAYKSFVSSECLGPKSADAKYPGVSLGNCRFTVKTNAGDATTFEAFVSAMITLPGMPDGSKVEDPKTHKLPLATTTTVTEPSASNAYVHSGFVPPVASPTPFSDKAKLAQLARPIVTRFEDGVSFSDEDGSCDDLGATTPPKFPAAEHVKFYCYTYYVNGSREHGELLLGLQTDASSKVTGFRYVAFGGFD